MMDCVCPLYFFRGIVHSEGEREELFMIRGIHHISMKTDSPEVFRKTKEFYTEILGLSIVRQWETGIMVETGNCWLEINNDKPGIRELGAIRHFAFYADEIDELTERIREAGYEVFIEPKDILIHSSPQIPARIAFCYGPLGEQIEFFLDRSENAERFSKF